jgi:ferredoxin
MPHVVTSSCYDCKYTDCVTVCPVDAFREAEKMLVIDPEVCIDCVLCVGQCPVKAIFLDKEVPEEERGFIQLNAEQAPILPVIDRKKAALAKD